MKNIAKAPWKWFSAFHNAIEGLKDLWFSPFEGIERETHSTIATRSFREAIELSAWLKFDASQSLNPISVVFALISHRNPPVGFSDVISGALAHTQTTSLSNLVYILSDLAHSREDWLNPCGCSPSNLFLWWFFMFTQRCPQDEHH